MDNVGIVVEDLDGVIDFFRGQHVADHRNAPVNALGYLRAMFTVDDIDDTLEWLGACGGEVVRDKDVYRLCYIRGPEGLLVGLAQEVC